MGEGRNGERKGGKGVEGRNEGEREEMGWGGIGEEGEGTRRKRI